MNFDQHSFRRGVGVYTREQVRSAEIDPEQFVQAVVAGTNPRPIMETSATAPPPLEAGSNVAAYETEKGLGKEVDEAELNDQEKLLITEERKLLTGEKIPLGGRQGLSVPGSMITFNRNSTGRLLIKTTAQIAQGLTLTTYMAPLDVETLLETHPKDTIDTPGHEIQALILEDGEQFVDLAARTEGFSLRGGNSKAYYDHSRRTATVGVPTTVTELGLALHEMYHGFADQDIFGGLGNATEQHRKNAAVGAASPEAGLLIGAEETYAWRGVLRDLQSLQEQGFAGIDASFVSEIVAHAQDKLAGYRDVYPATKAIDEAFSLKDIPPEVAEATLLTILRNAITEVGMEEDAPDQRSLAALARGLSWPDGMDTLEDWLDVQANPEQSVLAINPDIIKDISFIMFRHTPAVTRTIFMEADRYILTALGDSTGQALQDKRAAYFGLLHDLSTSTHFEESDHGFNDDVSSYFGFSNESTTSDRW